MTNELFDVLEVCMDTGKITMMGEAKSASNADAIERMAIMRRSTDDNFFVTVPTGKYKGGDVFCGEDVAS